MQHRVVVGGPPRWPLYALSALGLVGLIGWLLALALIFNFLPAPLAFLDSDFESGGQYAERVNLRKALETAESRANACELNTTAAARGKEIDARACEVLQESITRLEAEGAQLREQLAFYRSIAAPEQSKAGLRIVSLVLVRREAAGHWGYELMVLQPVVNARSVNASYRINLVGKVGGKPKTLTMDRTVTPTGGTSEFSVKTFATLTGEIKLPAEFTPNRAEITIEVVGKKGYAGKLSETFSWSKLVAAARK